MGCQKWHGNKQKQRQPIQRMHTKRTHLFDEKLIQKEFDFAAMRKAVGVELSAPSMIAKLEKQGLVDKDMAESLLHFHENGYTVLKKAAPLDLIDNYVAETKDMWEGKTAKNRVIGTVAKAEKNADGPAHRAACEKSKKCRLLDDFMVSKWAAKLAILPRVKMFLRLVYMYEPFAHQSLQFEYGSEQGIHLDPWYVRLDNPMELTASWVALEDITTENGPLHYYPTAHQFPHLSFPQSGPKRLSVGADPKALESEKVLHVAAAKWVHAKAREGKVGLQQFLAKKGDVLMWHAMLPHGGVPVKDLQSTRWIYVTHYAPLTTTPGYMLDEGCYKLSEGTQEFIKHYCGVYEIEGSFFSSSHYPGQPDEL